MKCLAEPIARRANAEDGCKGRFWEGRFKVQRLCDERAVLAAMAYVDLNPVRAGIARDLESSDHTSVQQRLATATPPQPDAPLAPVAGVRCAFVPIRLGEYVALVEWTGRHLRPGKRGVIDAAAPSALMKLDTPGRWTTRVKGNGSGYWRAVGEVEDLLAEAERIGQRWLKGIGLARKLASTK
jgi:hypothetical protein